MNFDAFIRSIREEKLDVFGAEVYRDGILSEQFGDTAKNRHPIYSATKSITSIAAGLAWDDGKIDLDTPLLCYLPEQYVQPLRAEQKECYHHITLRRLMSMSVQGYPFRPSGESWLASSLALPLEHPELPQFQYSNIPAYLVGTALTHAVEEDLYSYLNRRLFVPLEIDSPACGRCPDGYFYGASQMELTVNELSRIGMLFYHNGLHGKERILSEEYVHQATSVQQPNRDGGYGFFLWKTIGGCYISGKWGQKCFILPENGLLITLLSHVESSVPLLDEIIRKHLLS